MLETRPNQVGAAEEPDSDEEVDHYRGRDDVARREAPAAKFESDEEGNGTSGQQDLSIPIVGGLGLLCCAALLVVFWAVNRSRRTFDEAKQLAAHAEARFSEAESVMLRAEGEFADAAKKLKEANAKMSMYLEMAKSPEGGSDYSYNSGRDSCRLPRGAQWCRVNNAGVSSFEMAVYQVDDPVSRDICKLGTWDIKSAKLFGQPGHALDIGGHIGFSSFVLAKAGWNVTMFEPLHTNLALTRASLCRNADIAEQIDLRPVGLGAADAPCHFFSHIRNVGDGWTSCSGLDAKTPPDPGFEYRGQFSVKRLDDELSEIGVENVDFVKLDVEGFECKVLEGGHTLFSAFRPRLFRSEVWAKQMQDCEPEGYLDIFRKAGYAVGSDATCEDTNITVPSGDEELADFFMCKQDGAR